MSKNAARSARKLANDIADAASFYQFGWEPGPCDRMMRAAFARADRAAGTGSTDDLKKARAAWARARKCFVRTTGYSHRARKR